MIRNLLITKEILEEKEAFSILENYRKNRVMIYLLSLENDTYSDAPFSVLLSSASLDFKAIANSISAKPFQIAFLSTDKELLKKANAVNYTTVQLKKADEEEKVADFTIQNLLEMERILERGIIFNRVCKSYQKDSYAVKDFTMECDDREFLVFVGPSGCGKSTTLRMIAGLEEITSGDIYINGVRINDEEPKDRNLAMVFQNYALYPQFTVYKNIAFPLKNYKFKRARVYQKRTAGNKFLNFFFNLYNKCFLSYYHQRHYTREEIDEKVKAIAKILGLETYLDRKPSELSGGQKQRVALGRALIRNPQVFLLDEPLSNLDAKMRTQMRTEITKLHEQVKTTFVYVTHDQIEAMTMGTKIVCMKDGLIQQIGTPEEIYKRPANKFVAGFIGTPQMNFISGLYDRENNAVKALNCRLKLPEGFLKDCDCKDVILGIRPKNIDITDEKDYHFKAVISLKEELGDETLLYTRINGKNEDFIISTNSQLNCENGDTIYFKVQLDNLHIFSSESEENLRR